MTTVGDVWVTGTHSDQVGAALALTGEFRPPEGSAILLRGYARMVFKVKCREGKARQ